MSGLVLASQSPTRARILRDAGVAFRAMDPGVDEAVAKARLLAAGATPLAIAEALAEEKAVAASSREPGLIIAADQTLELDGASHDKPADLAEARARLLALRGRVHALHAATALARGGEIVWRHAATAHLKMRMFSDAFVDDYLAATGAAATGSVGAYQLEGRGAQLFEWVEGDFFAILGLPLIPLLDALRREGLLAR